MRNIIELLILYTMLLSTGDHSSWAVLSTGDLIIPAVLYNQLEIWSFQRCCTINWISDHSSGAVLSTGDLIIPAVLYYQLEITHDNRLIKNAYTADQWSSNMIIRISKQVVVSWSILMAISKEEFYQNFLINFSWWKPRGGLQTITHFNQLIKKTWW